MGRELSQEELSAIAVFPLPNLVMFPGTTLAFHIFEPRYREMMRDLLREGRMAIAVAQLKPDWQAAYQGRPAWYEVAGAGRVVSHIKRPDGTFDIEVESLARVRLDELAPDYSYRRARAVVLHESMPESGMPTRELTALLSLATSIVELAQQNDRLEAVEILASADDIPTLMLDRLAHQFVSDAAARQQLLETLDVATRMRVLRGYLAELRLSVLAETPRGPRTLH